MAPPAFLPAGPRCNCLIVFGKPCPFKLNLTLLVWDLVEVKAAHGLRTSADCDAWHESMPRRKCKRLHQRSSPRKISVPATKVGAPEMSSLRAVLPSSRARQA